VQRLALPLRIVLIIGLCASAAVQAAAAQAAALDVAAQQRIRAATFEVVQKKPEESAAVTYDHPLPLELIPFQERNDKYRSVGTAFAIGGNRYVTAGHVFMLGAGSQFGPPALRDPAGTVYEIDKVWKFSDHEDFVVFSLRTEPKGVQSLELGPVPPVNDPVFAVGNALGEGIVIRDGVYTSDTPEEQDGEWKWLRFSAAASPGNSGGPLIDSDGRVIGVVLRKSESENLNYALPIERVRDSKDGEGRLGGRAPIRLPIIDVSETIDVKSTLVLPKAPPEFFNELRTQTIERVERGQRDLLAHNHDRLFPNSAKSSQLLHSELSSAFPRVMHEGQDGVWALGSEQTSTLQLDHNGFVEILHGLLRLRRPDDVSLTSLYGDSKLFMDLLLKGYAVRRQVGSESVKVTSLGKAEWSSTHTDAYGRVWQIAAWNEPWADTALVAMSLPTPEGYVVVLAPTSSGFRQLAVDTAALLVDYVYVSIGGTLWQWQEYLAQKNIAPKVFSTLKIDIDPTRRVQFRSRRCEFTVTPELLALSRDSQLWLKLTYFRDGDDSVVWDVGGVSVSESAQKHNWVEFWRVVQPDGELPERFQSHWRKLQGGEFPYNGMVRTDNGATRISATAEKPSGDGSAAKVRYTLTAQGEGDQTQEAMAPKLELLKRSFKPLEQ
jgi:hypothetical protein